MLMIATATGNQADIICCRSFIVESLAQREGLLVEFFKV